MAMVFQKIILLIPIPIVLHVVIFSQQHPYTSLFVFKLFFVLVYAILCNIAIIVQRTFEIVQKLRSHRHGDMFIPTNTSTTNPETCTCEVRNCVEVGLLHV